MPRYPQQQQQEQEGGSWFPFIDQIFQKIHPLIHLSFGALGGILGYAHGVASGGYLPRDIMLGFMIGVCFLILVRFAVVISFAAVLICLVSGLFYYCLFTPDMRNNPVRAIPYMADMVQRGAQRAKAIVDQQPTEKSFFVSEPKRPQVVADQNPLK